MRFRGEVNMGKMPKPASHPKKAPKIVVGGATVVRAGKDTRVSGRKGR